MRKNLTFRAPDWVQTLIDEARARAGRPVTSTEIILDLLWQAGAAEGYTMSTREVNRGN